MKEQLYAETKVEFEKYILDNIKNLDYSPIILRLATAFGISKRMRFDLTISEFTRELALGNELLVFDENTWRPYCHVSDISDAIIKVLETPKDKVYGQVFNVGSNNENYTKKMILELIQKYIDTRKSTIKKAGLIQEIIVYHSIKLIMFLIMKHIVLLKNQLNKL